MRGQGPIQSLAASPTMVGAVTTLIVIVAVFLAYNANQGLPFVPVYRVAVEVPNASRLVDNNEVRIGGNRVGVVETIEPIKDDDATQTAQADGGAEAANDTGGTIAQLNLKLDKAAEPLPQDSVFRIRYRSSFGLKYLEIIRGTGPPAPEGFTFDGTDDGTICDLPTDLETFSENLPESSTNGCFQSQTEFDDINNTFDHPTRQAARTNLAGFGSGFAGRGLSLNDAVAGLEPLFRNLKPVARVLSANDTQLGRFFSELGDSARIVAPVAAVQAQFFTNAAIAFAAISEDVAAFQETISESPPTLEVGIETLPRQRLFLRDFATLSRELRPGVRDLRITLPVLNDAIEVGTPILRRTPRMNRLLRGVFRELNELVSQPSTKITLERLEETFAAAEPLARYVAPAQTVCNYFNYWFTFVPSGFDRTQVSYTFRQMLTQFPRGPLAFDTELGTLELPGEVQTPLAGYSGKQANGRDDEGVFKPWELPVLNASPYMPTGQNGSDCQGGQSGYKLGQLRIPGQPKSNPAIGFSDLPGDRGPTTLFFNDAGERELHDTRIDSRQPGTWRRIR